MGTFETGFMAEIRQEEVFSTDIVKNIFIQWCYKNARISATFIPRKELSYRNFEDALKKGDEDELTLSIPLDLNLEEAIDVIRVIDSNTPSEIPDSKNGRVEQVKELGEIFEKAGLYLQEYLMELDEGEGRVVAKDVANEFYQYGVLLQRKNRDDDQIIIPEDASLSEEDKRMIDEWLLGGKIYQKRMEKLGESLEVEAIEQERRRLIKLYFSALVKEVEDGEEGPIKNLQDRIRIQIGKAMERPKIEIKAGVEIAIFRNGINRFLKEANWKAFFPYLPEDEVRLYDALSIPELKAELEAVRQTGNLEEISRKELEIAWEIQRTLSNFSYSEGAYNYSEIMDTDSINCLGASVLAGRLLEEVGIRYLHASVPKHSVIVLITSDQTAHWQDFTPGAQQFTHYLAITDDAIDERAEDLSIISEYHDSYFSATITFKDFNPYPHVSGKLRAHLFDPKINFPCHIFHSMGVALKLSGKYEDSVEVFRSAIAINPNEANSYHGLGEVLCYLGRCKEAVEVLEKAVAIDQGNSIFYNDLGFALNLLSRYKEAIEAFKKTIIIDPNCITAYYGLGDALCDSKKAKTAVRIYKKAVALDPNSAFSYYELATGFYQWGRYKMAVKKFKKSIDLDPNDPFPHNGLGLALNQLGKYEEAIETFRNAIIIDPNYISAYCGLGEALYQLGRYEEAIVEYGKLISLCGEDRDFVEWVRARIEEMEDGGTQS